MKTLFYYCLNNCQAQVQSQIQVPNPSPKFRSQIQVPDPKSKVQRKGTRTYKPYLFIVFYISCQESQGRVLPMTPNSESLFDISHCDLTF